MFYITNNCSANQYLVFTNLPIKEYFIRHVTNIYADDNLSIQEINTTAESEVLDSEPVFPIQFATEQDLINKIIELGNGEYGKFVN